MSQSRSGSASQTMASAAGESGVVDRVARVDVIESKSFVSRAGSVAARRRLRGAIPADEVVRGAPAEELLRPAGELLGAMPWSGAVPDPNVLDAVTFLAWL